ncbi:MAG: DUF1929 domain-containing protein [Planctomycetes bacterium]|nr:DUF1929 domain-containing protein [Planctomycetota bacterium]
MNRCLILSLVLCPAVAFGQQGVWEDPFGFGDSTLGFTRAVHLVHVWNGQTTKVLALSYNFPDSRLWTPPPASLPGAPGVFESADLPTFTFCGGHSALPDGRILHVGGGEFRGPYLDGADLFDPFNPVGSQWNNPTVPPDMSFRRWYPTATTLGDGRIFVCAGLQDDGGSHATIPELYDPIANVWTLLVSANRQQKLYPYMFVLPDGRLVDAGPGPTSFLDPSTWFWSGQIPEPPGPNPPGSGGSAVMYEPGKIMRCGGQSTAVATTWVVDLNNNPDVGWLNASPMNKPRRNHNLVVLPDGKVLAVGGNTDDNQIGPVFEAEIFDPASGKWTIQPSSHGGHHRKYHSTAMLLPDGRVVLAGGDTKKTAQIFKPPYITSEADRPIITSVLPYWQYGQTYTVQYNQNGGPVVTKACLIRLASVTHGFDQDQRRVPLVLPDGAGPATFDVTAPADGNIAPPGYYMLFILNEYAANQFAPCEMAAYVQIGP